MSVHVLEVVFVVVDYPHKSNSKLYKASLETYILIQSRDDSFFSLSKSGFRGRSVKLEMFIYLVSSPFCFV